MKPTPQPHNIEHEEELEKYIEQTAEIIIEEDFNHDKEITQAYVNDNDWQSPMGARVGETLDGDMIYVNTMEQWGRLYDILEDLGHDFNLGTSADNPEDMLKTHVYIVLKGAVEREIEDKLENMDESKKTALQL